MTRGRVNDDATLVEIYLKEIGRYPLLSREQEGELAEAVAAGRRAAAELAGSQHLDAGRRAVLEAQVRAGEEATERFVQANLRLVVAVAKRYLRSGLHLLDLIQEGNLGLIHAVGKFDHTRGYKFSTYATWWIRQAIGRAVTSTGRCIRLPAHADDQLVRARQASAAFEMSHGRAPTTAELAATLGIAEAKLDRLLPYLVEPVSLSEPVGDDNGLSLGDVLAQPGQPGPDDVVVESVLRDALPDMLAPLDEREREVLLLRYGLDRGEPRTLEEVGARFHLTREGIRQIEARAMTKLRRRAAPDCWLLSA